MARRSIPIEERIAAQEQEVHSKQPVDSQEISCYFCYKSMAIPLIGDSPCIGKHREHQMTFRTCSRQVSPVRSV